ncbi:hypothetical protein [Bradyrhizobium sacchari]|uniref:hypothetical protein n=1 Tax=Bradyrhizobium sacchari TaxID=1399419 RepID=UPI003D313400
MFQRHALVLGRTGSGKSWTTCSSGAAGASPSRGHWRTDQAYRRQALRAGSARGTCMKSLMSNISNRYGHLLRKSFWKRIQHLIYGFCGCIA